MGHAFESTIHDKLDRVHKLDSFMKLNKKDLQFKIHSGISHSSTEVPVGREEVIILPTNSPDVLPTPKKKRYTQ